MCRLDNAWPSLAVVGSRAQPPVGGCLLGIRRFARGASLIGLFAVVAVAAGAVIEVED